MKKKYVLIIFLICIPIITSTRLKENDFFTIEARNLAKKINRLSVSLDNEHLLNNLILRFENYIFNHDIDRPGVPKEKYYNIRNLTNNFTQEEDGTYEVYNHKSISFNKGYQVSFETSFDDYTNEDYDEICYKLSLMTDNKVYLGVWGGIPEFSFYFEDFDLANAVAILFNQMAIWDWSVMEPIYNQFHKEYK